MKRKTTLEGAYLRLIIYVYLNKYIKKLCLNANYLCYWNIWIQLFWDDASKWWWLAYYIWKWIAFEYTKLSLLLIYNNIEMYQIMGLPVSWAAIVEFLRVLLGKTNYSPRTEDFFNHGVYLHGHWFVQCIKKRWSPPEQGHLAI